MISPNCVALLTVFFFLIGKKLLNCLKSLLLANHQALMHWLETTSTYSSAHLGMQNGLESRLNVHRDWFIKNCKGILPYCVCTYTIRKLLLIFPKSMDLDLSKMVQHIFLAQFLQKLRAKMFQTNFFKNSQNWSKLLTFL